MQWESLWIYMYLPKRCIVKMISIIIVIKVNIKASSKNWNTSVTQAKCVCVNEWVLVISVCVTGYFWACLFVFYEMISWELISSLPVSHSKSWRIGVSMVPGLACWACGPRWWMTGAAPVESNLSAHMGWWRWQEATRWWHSEYQPRFGPLPGTVITLTLALERVRIKTTAIVH